MPDVTANRRSCTLASAPGLSGDFVIASAQPGYLGFGAAHDGKSFSVAAVNGTSWELRTGCTYTHATTTLSRGRLEESSSGSAVNLGSTTVVSVVLPAVHAAAISRGAPQRNAINIGLLGDSITHNGYYTNGTAPDGVAVPTYYLPGATNNYGRAWGWGTWVGPLSMQRIQVVKSWARQTNGVLAPGISPVGWPLSAQITQMLADPLFAKVDRVAIMIGTNDQFSTLAAWSAELLTQIARIGRPVDLLTPPPRSDGAAMTTGGDSLRGWAWLQQCRLVIKRIAEASGGWVRYIDAYSRINSPLANPDGFGANMYLPDTTHPSNVGAYLMADAYVAATLPDSLYGDLDVWPSNSSAYFGGAAALDQAFNNPGFATTTGGSGTGDIAADLTVTNVGGASHVGSSIANPVGPGNMQRLVITSTAAGDGVDVLTSSVHDAGGTFLAAGDEAFGQALVTIQGGGIYPRNLFFRLNYFDGTTGWLSLLFEVPSTPLAPGDEKALPLTGTRSFLLRTPRFIVPATAATNLTVKFRPTFAGAGSCTIDIGNLEVRRLRAGAVYT